MNTLAKFRSTKLLLLAFCMPLITHAAEMGTALKADSLRTEPYADAKTLSSLNKGDAVEILSKKGGWLNVKANGKTGWVRILSVKRGASATSGNNSASLLNMASGRSGTGKVVSSTGVRGLNEEELKNATFNEPEVRKMESFQQSSEQANGFAKDASLKARPFEYLAAPQSNDSGETR